MTAPNAKETEGYAYSLEQVAQEYFDGYAEAQKQYGSAASPDYTPATMDNWLTQVNAIEDRLEFFTQKRGKPLTMQTFADMLRGDSLDEIMRLFSPVAKDTAPVTNADLADNRPLPPGYTFGQYRKEKLPLFNSIASQLATREVQDSVIRPIALEKVNERLQRNQQYIQEGSMLTPKARLETPILQKLSQNLTQRNAPAMGVPTKF